MSSSLPALAAHIAWPQRERHTHTHQVTLQSQLMGAPAGNFRVVVLRKSSVIVSVLTLRVCGLGFAEMPFVATREGAIMWTPNPAH
jgi:hypothetical protein